MSKIVYKTTERGDIQKVSTGQVFGVRSARVTKSRRGQVVELELATGKKKKVLRWQVDETAHSFGPQITEELKPPKKTKPQKKQAKRKYARRATTTAVVVQPKVDPPPSDVRFELVGNVLYAIRRVALTPEQMNVIHPEPVR